MDKKYAVLSYSGGMDSTGLLLRLLAQDFSVHALSFFYGQKHNVEIDRSMDVVSLLEDKGMHVDHKIIDLSRAMSLFDSALTDPDVEIPDGHYEEENMKLTVVPNRNAIFSSLIYGYALSLAQRKECEVPIALGVHSGDHAIYPDCRPEFYTALEAAFKLGNWNSEKVHYYLPYLDGDKFTILDQAVFDCEKLGVDFEEIFRNTNTCYKPNIHGESCGKCGSCTERLEAFKKVGIEDPVKYQEKEN
jgi:7-cyano-7-deazaguanine synthase